MKALLFLLGALSITPNFYSQVGIGTTTPSPASMLEVSSTSDEGDTYAGFMPPRVPNIVARNLINVALSDAGLIIFLNSSGCLQFWTGTDWENIKCSTNTPNPPTLLGIQNFEVIPASPNLAVSGINPANYQTGNGPFPIGLPRYVSATRGYGIINGSTELTFGPVDASSYTFVIVKFHLASFASTLNQGADADDNVVLSMSDDGITFLDEIKILGYDNSKWGFNNAQVANANYNGNGIPTIFQSTGTYATGIGKVELTNFPAGSNVFFKIRFKNDRSDEIWIIDDVEVFGL